GDGGAVGPVEPAQQRADHRGGEDHRHDQDVVGGGGRLAGLGGGGLRQFGDPVAEGPQRRTGLAAFDLDGLVGVVHDQQVLLLVEHGVVVADLTDQLTGGGGHG